MTIKYKFYIARDDEGVFISLPDEVSQTFGFDGAPPRIYLGANPTLPEVNKILQESVRSWYALCAEQMPERMLACPTNYYDDGLPKTISMSVA